MGLPSPFADPVVQMMKVRRQLSRQQREALWDQEKKRQMQGFCRVQGHTVRRITPEESAVALDRKGITGRRLSRTYTWGPHIFVVDMTLDDIELLMAMHLAHPKAFQVLDDIITL